MTERVPLVTLLESHPAAGAARRPLTARVTRMLDDLVALRGRWIAEKRRGSLPPSDADLQVMLARVKSLPVTVAR